MQRGNNKAKNNDYQRRVFNTRKFAEAVLKGEIKICYEINDKKVTAVYVPKEILKPGGSK